MADINEDELTGYQPPSDSTGGLTPVSITASGTIAANTRENVTVPGAPITRTLPPLPTSGQDPISWLINDDARTVTEANYIRIQPAAGQRLASHLAIDEPLDLDGPGMWASGGAAAGDTDWGLQLQATTMAPPPGMVPGYTGGVAIPAGMIGESLVFTSRATTGSTGAVVANATALGTLTPGVWLIYARGIYSRNNSANSVFAGVATNSAGDFTGIVASSQESYTTVSGTSENNVMALIPGQVVNVSVNTPLYAKSFSEDAAVNVTIAGFAVRIA